MTFSRSFCMYKLENKCFVYLVTFENFPKTHKKTYVLDPLLKQNWRLLAEFCKIDRSKTLENS